MIKNDKKIFIFPSTSQYQNKRFNLAGLQLDLLNALPTTMTLKNIGILVGVKSKKWLIVIHGWDAKENYSLKCIRTIHPMSDGKIFLNR